MISKAGEVVMTGIVAVGVTDAQAGSAGGMTLQRSGSRPIQEIGSDCDQLMAERGFPNLARPAQEHHFPGQIRPHAVIKI
jgi:hypothetical protein